jgi:hypothetical protein
MLVGLLLTGVASSSISLACSMAFSPISVGSSFKVQVSGYGGPVKGLRLNLSGGQGRTPSAVTDNNGIATFSDVPLGTQYLGADRDNGYNLPLKVTQDGPARIGMRWPSTEPIQVSSISGTMRAPDAIPGQDRADGKKILQQISRETGGEYFDVTKKMPLEMIYDRIEQDLRNQYSLGYTSDQTGGAYYRKIHVATKDKNQTILARDGYYPASSKQP